jgi:predicted ATPase
VIRSVEIHGLRGIREGKLTDLTPLVLLVGPNGSGKSTILDSLLIAASPRSGEGAGQAVDRRQELPHGGRWLFWKGGREEPARITLATDSDAVRSCELRLIASSFEHAQVEAIVKDQEAGQDVRRYSCHVNFQKGHPYGAGGSFSPLRDVPDVRLLDSHGSLRGTPLHQLYTRIVEQGLRKQATVSQTGPRRG